MFKETIFKEYDIRGVYPTDFDESFAYLLGKSYGSYIQEKLGRKKCVVGFDNRLSSPILHEYLIKGLLESGCNVRDYGCITTPMHYYSRYLNHSLGIMITASHNPKEDNGFKFSFDDLANARGSMIEDLKQYTLNGNFLTGKGMYEKADMFDEYLAYMKRNISMGQKKLKVVIDPGNGVTALYVKQIHSLFPNLEVTYICDTSDGNFPYHHPDPSVEENLTLLKETVKKEQADVGIAYDGDGDRVGVVCENGEKLSADTLMIIFVRNLIDKVKNKTFLYDVKCSKALEDEIRTLGGTPYCYRTGASYTEYETKKKNLSFGGEYSGHLFFNDRDYAIGSGIYAGLRLLEILSNTSKSVSELIHNIPIYYSTEEIRIPCSNETKFQVIENIKNYVKEKQYPFIDIDGIRIQFEDSWALIRASNTGPNLTLRFEATTKERLSSIQKEFMQVVEKYNP